MNKLLAFIVVVLLSAGCAASAFEQTQPTPPVPESWKERFDTPESKKPPDNQFEIYSSCKAPQGGQTVWLSKKSGEAWLLLFNCEERQLPGQWLLDSMPPSRRHKANVLPKNGTELDVLVIGHYGLWATAKILHHTPATQ